MMLYELDDVEKRVLLGVGGVMKRNTETEIPLVAIQCPHCGGRGANQGLACGSSGCQMRTLTCSTCKGAGVISEYRQAQIEKGEAMRRDRISRDMTQREEAKRLGLNVVIYSQMERGVYDGEQS